MNQLFTKKIAVFKARENLQTFILGLFFTFCTASVAIAQTSPALACNDKVQISLDENCEAKITADMVLEGDRSDYACFKVNILDKKGGNILLSFSQSGSGVVSGGPLTGEHLDQLFAYEAVDTCGENSCWGQILVEEKIPPTVECIMQEVDCGSGTTPGNPINELEKLEADMTTMDGDTLLLKYELNEDNGSTIFDINVFLDLTDDLPLSDLSSYIRYVGGGVDSVLYLFKNPLKDNEDPNCLDAGFIGEIDDETAYANAALQSTSVCRLQDFPSIVGNFKSLDTLSKFKGLPSDAGNIYVGIVSSSGKTVPASIVNRAKLKIWITEEYVNIPVWNPDAVITKVGTWTYKSGAFRIDSLGLCDAVEASFLDTYVDGCTDDYIAFISREWSVKDKSGNEAICYDTIKIERSEFPHDHLKTISESDIILPPDYDNTDDEHDLPALTCPDDYAGYELENGAPSPEVTGYPFDESSFDRKFCSNMQAAFEDQIIPVCENSFKVIRTWTLLDWCDGYISDFPPQIIKVVDDVEPVIDCEPIDSVYMDSNPFMCGVDYEVPEPNVIQECGTYTWTVEYYIPDVDDDSGELPADAEFVSDNVVVVDGQVVVEGLPHGCSWIKYIVTDGCGNVSDGKCIYKVLVKDNIPPSPICDEHTTVGLTIDGYGILHAASLDDDSWDNCGVESFKVAKMTDECHTEKDPEFQANIFQDKVKFCCAEVGTVIMVQLRVWDGSGNYNDCMVEVSVQDKIPPIIRCPEDVTLECQIDYKNTEISGVPEIIDDNCKAEEPTFVDTDYLDQCGIGHVYRVWTVGDIAGFKVSCTQHIYLKDFDPFEMEDRDFPEDIELVECTSAIDPDVTGFPKLDDDDKCSLVASTYTDQEFSFVDEACKKIIREWTVIDWCQYERIDSCVDESQIDLTIDCPTNDKPVCGCDGVTYENACAAEYYGGVSDWIEGPCNAACKNPLNLTELIDFFGDYDEDAEVREIKWEEKYYYVVFTGLQCIIPDDPWTPDVDTTVYNCLGEEISAPWDDQPEGTVIWSCDGPPEVTNDAADRTNPGLWRSQQIIKINNYDGPVFAECKDTIFSGFGPGCSGEITLTASAIDDCTPDDELKWHWKIYAFGNGFPFNPTYTGHSNDASDIYPFGTHRIQWTVEDNCGNATVCDYFFTVKDEKEPTPYCLASVTTVVMPNNGQVQIWASDFDHASTDNCTDNNDLIFTFSDDITDQYIWFDCDDIPDGKSASISLEMWVTDEAGNQDYCTVELELQDNFGDFCDDVSTGSTNLEGNVTTEDNQRVTEVQIELDSNIPEFPKTTITDLNGRYTFNNIPLGNSYRLTALRGGNAINGVSTLDLVLVQQHILGLQSLESPYRVIAADSDNSGSVSAADLVYLRKLILGVTDQFPNQVNAWKFIDAAQSINMNNPFIYSDYIQINSLDRNYTNLNFMAIKTGDVTGNAQVNQLATTEVRSNGRLGFLVDAQDLITNEQVQIDFTAENFTDIIGFQFTLGFDATAMEFESVTAGKLDLDLNNIGITKAANGLVTVSWNDVNAKSLNTSDVLFRLTFNAKKNVSLSSMFELNSDITVAEAYDGNYEGMDAKLGFRNEYGEIFELMQNTPNPFSGHTEIGFILPKSASAVVTVFDLSGKITTKIEANYSKGLNKIKLNKDEIGGSGVYYYRIETDGFTATRKMITID